MVHHRTSLMFAFFFAFITVNSMGANIVLNPGFELGAANWTYTPAVSGADFHFGTFGSVHSGTNAAAFGGSTIGSYDTISQSLTTIAGDSYQFTFWMAIGATGGSSNGLEVFWNGTMIKNTNNAASSLPYTQFGFTEVASSTNTVIAFAGYNTAYFSNVDDVSVTDLGSSVPEPPTWRLWTCGFPVFLGLRKLWTARIPAGPQPVAP